jgi:phosphatidylglycerophosphate synthase
LDSPRALRQSWAMLDALLRPVIDPPLNRLGRALSALGVGANAVTLAGLALGLGAGAAIWAGAYALALVLVLGSRLADGLDGAVARARGITDTGGYLDIVSDFGFYAAIPLGFVLADPAAHGAAGAFLLASFYVNGGSFLGRAVLAAQRGEATTARGKKSFFHAGGLLEGTETIVFFCALCLWPALFSPLAWGFGALCLVTAVWRVAETLRASGRP